MGHLGRVPWHPRRVYGLIARTQTCVRVRLLFLLSLICLGLRFDISNTDHVKSVRILDRVTIVCPRPPVPNASNDPLTALHTAEDTYEYSKLFMVGWLFVVGHSPEGCLIRQGERE